MIVMYFAKNLTVALRFSFVQRLIFAIGFIVLDLTCN